MSASLFENKDNNTFPLELLGFPGVSVVKNLSVSAEDMGWSLGQKIPWRRKWQPIPVFLPEKEDRTEEPDGSCSCKRVRHNLVIKQQQRGFYTLLCQTKVCLVKAMFFSVVMYVCENWTIKKTEHWRIDAFELWCWRRLLRVPWTARKSNQSMLREISPEYSL